MSEAFRFIAAQQRAEMVRRVAAYVRTHNPEVTQEQAEFLGSVVAEYFQPVPRLRPPQDQGYFVNKAKEFGNNLLDPDAHQQWQDKRERRRNAPIDRAYRELKAREHKERVEKELGYSPKRNKTLDERVKDMGNYVKRRRTPKTPEPAPQVEAPPPAQPAKPANPLHELVKALENGPVAAPDGLTAPPAAAHPAPPSVESDDDSEGFDHSREVIDRLRKMPGGVEQ